MSEFESVLVDKSKQIFYVLGPLWLTIKDKVGLNAFNGVEFIKYNLNSILLAYYVLG